jgi:catechol 2,3-dioxygenase-like lactoylglutathione lyase family enzyme
LRESATDSTNWFSSFERRPDHFEIEEPIDNGRVGFRASTTKEPPMTTATGIISGVDFIAVSTKDFEKARDFYANVLGLEESKRWGDMPAQEFETGNLTIAVMQSDAFGIEPSTNSHPIEFHVDDFEGAKAELESRGVEFSGEPIDSGVCLQAFFRDPDGNALAIHHRYDKS